MLQKRALASQSRVKDLDDKFVLCDPLPDPNDEKDLTTFITLWREGKDKTLADCKNNCQTAEDVIKAINKILVEAKSQYDYPKIRWCQAYIEEIRAITKKKFDDISADVLTYIENYTEFTEEELEAARKMPVGQKKQEGRSKQEFTL